jgi:hypothetical protein
MPTITDCYTVAIAFIGGLELKPMEILPQVGIDRARSSSTGLALNLVLAHGAAADNHTLHPFDLLPVEAEAELATPGQLRFRRKMGRQVEARLQLGQHYRFLHLKQVDADRYFIWH